MRKTNLLLIAGLFILALSLCTCTSKANKEIPKATQDSIIRAEIKKERNRLIDSVKNLYNARIDWDTMHYSKSIMFDSTINAVVCFRRPEVVDVYRRDTNYYASVSLDRKVGFYFDLIISKRQADFLIQKEYEKCAMIVRVTKVRKMPIQVKAQNGDEDEDASISLETDEKKFSCKGILLEIINCK